MGKMPNADVQYLNLMQDILDNGQRRPNRTGTDTLSVFNRQMNFNLQEGFPLLTSKEMNFQSILGELEWFLSGSTTLRDIRSSGSNVWNKDAYRWYMESLPKGIAPLTYEGFLNYDDAHGFDLGPIYGEQLRGGPDQFMMLVNGLLDDPYGRRHVISLWNHNVLDRIALPACHGLVIQFYVDHQDFLNCNVYLRSNDFALGAPYNMASYALLMHLVGHITGYKPKMLNYLIGDAHLYVNHVEGALKQVRRLRDSRDYIPRLEVYDSDYEGRETIPKWADEVFSINIPVYDAEYIFTIMLKKYIPLPKIKYDLSVGL